MISTSSLMNSRERERIYRAKAIFKINVLNREVSIQKNQYHNINSLPLPEGLMYIKWVMNQNNCTNGDYDSFLKAICAEYYRSRQHPRNTIRNETILNFRSWTETRTGIIQ